MNIIKNNEKIWFKNSQFQFKLLWLKPQNSNCLVITAYPCYVIHEVLGHKLTIHTDGIGSWRWCRIQHYHNSHPQHHTKKPRNYTCRNDFHNDRLKFNTGFWFRQKIIRQILMNELIRNSCIAHAFNRINHHVHITIRI